MLLCIFGRRAKINQKTVRISDNEVQVIDAQRGYFHGVSIPKNRSSACLYIVYSTKKEAILFTENIASLRLLSAVVSVGCILVVSGIGSIAGCILCFVLILLLVLGRIAAVVAVSVVCIAVVVAVVVCIVVVVLHDNLHSENS